MRKLFTKAALTLVVVGFHSLPAFAVPMLKAPDLRHSAKVTVEEIHEAWAQSLKQSEAANACFKHSDEEDYQLAYVYCQQWWSEEPEGLAKDIATGLVVLNIGELAQSKKPPRSDNPIPRRRENFSLGLELP